MYYINAKRLADLAVEHKILAEQDGCIAVYREAGADPEEFPEGWYLEDKEEVYQEVMRSEDAQTVLIGALKEHGVEFIPMKIF